LLSIPPHLELTMSIAILGNRSRFQVEVFWGVTPCSAAVGYQRFRDLDASETLVSYRCTTLRRHKPEDSDLNFYCRENLKSWIFSATRFMQNLRSGSRKIGNQLKSFRLVSCNSSVLYKFVYWCVILLVLVFCI